jgi:hypothetical protein
VSDRQTLAESRPTLLAEATGTPGRYKVQLINPGWGSSGHYSAAVLTEAATAKVFPAGLKMYADHPRGDGSGVDEHGNRSVQDVWGKLVTDAQVTESGALTAEVQVRPDIAPVVDFLSDAIGLSIRGHGTFEVGEAEGRTGQIITSIVEATSVDFVTDAGRGGQILGLVESARRTMLGEATANDVRDALGTAVDDVHGGDEIYTWVRDYDPDKGVVYFEVSGNVEPRGTFQQAYTLAADGSASLTGDRQEVTPRTTYVPVNSPAGSTPTTESQGGTMTNVTIDEAEHRRLVERDGRVQTLESELATERQRAEQAEATLAEGRRRDDARPVIAEAFSGSQLHVDDVTEVTESLLADLPTAADGTLDTAALTTRATEARTKREASVARYLSENGVGRVTGFGSTGGGTVEVTESDFDKAVASAFGRPTASQEA